MQRRTLAAVVLVAVLLTTGCGQKGRYGATLIAEGTHEVASGESLKGELIVMGGEARLAENSRIEGSVYVLGGNLDVAGEIDGNVAALGGSVVLHPGSRVHGDLRVGGADVTIPEGPVVDGDVISGMDVAMPLSPGWWSDRSLGAQVAWLLARTVVVAALAFLAVRLIPRPVSRVANALTGQPVVSGAVGLLAAVVAPSLLVAMAFTVILAPVAVVGFVLLGATIAYGWIAIGLVAGQRLGRWRGWKASPAVLASAGTLVFTLVLTGIAELPFVGIIGDVFTLVSVAVGFGAVLLTRFGLRGFARPADGAPGETQRATA